MNNIDNKIGYLNENFRIFHIRNKESIEFEYHHHDFNKIVILIEGNLTYLIEGKSYTLKPWDILFVNNNEIHKPVVDSDKVYERIVIWLSPKFMKDNSFTGTNLLKCFEDASSYKYNLLRLKLSDIDVIKNIIHEIINCETSDEFGSEIFKNTLFIQLIVIINRFFINIDKSKKIEDIQYDELIENILTYINENISSDLSIDLISSKFFTSKYYLMRRFKSQTGSSIHSYIVKKRLMFAKSLINEGFSMNETCVKCGFNDYSSFVRAFKKVYGVSPSKYASSKHQYFNDNFTKE